PFICCSLSRSPLHPASFPTRRSSDLISIRHWPADRSASLQRIRLRPADLRVDLRAEQQRQARQIEPEHQEDHPTDRAVRRVVVRSEEHTSELQSRVDLVCRLLLEKKK